MNAPPPPSSSIAHRWDLTPTAAIALQRELAGRIDLRAPAGFAPRTIAGVDIGFEDEGRTTRAAIVVLDSAALLPLSHVVARRPTTFPYVPGLLSFRELPAALAAFELLPARPDLLMVDGHGVSHPRRLGVAAHLGLLLDLPAIGVAKSRLTGHHGPVPEPRGEWTPLFAGPARARSTEVIGAVLRSRAGVQPIIVSPGHRMDLDTALHWVRHCLTRYRLPEPTRWADGLASRRAGILRQLEPLPPP